MFDPIWQVTSRSSFNEELYAPLTLYYDVNMMTTMITSTTTRMPIF